MCIFVASVSVSMSVGVSVMCPCLRRVSADACTRTYTCILTCRLWDFLRFVNHVPFAL